MRNYLPSYSQGFARYAAESEAPELRRGLVGAWPFFLGHTGMTARDWSGHGNNGVFNNGATWSTNGRAASFPGTDDEITVPDSNSLDLDNVGTLVLRVFLTTLSGTQLMSMKKQVFGDAGGWQVFANGTGLQVRGGGATATWFGGFFTGLQDTWVDVAVTLDGLSCDVYRDGVFVANDNIGATAANAHDLIIGRYFNSTSNSFSGEMEFHYVYNRKLSAAEIMRLHQYPMAMWRPLYAPSAMVPVGGDTFYRTPSDSITFTESVVKSVGLVKSDSLTLAESVAKSFGIVTSDALSLAESVANQFGLNPSDALSLADAVVKQIAVAVLDSLNLAEVAAKSMGLSPSDSIAFSDSVSKILAITRSVVDSITFSDSVVKTVGLNKSDLLTLAETVAKQIGISVDDALALAESAIRGIVGILTRAVADQLNLSDSVITALIRGAVHKARKDFKAHDAEDIEWHEIIEIERKEEEGEE